MKRGIDVLRDPFLNKGTAFTNEERKDMVWSECCQSVFNQLKTKQSKHMNTTNQAKQL